MMQKWKIFDRNTRLSRYNAYFPGPKLFKNIS
jgi:hypothetical protein